MKKEDSTWCDSDDSSTSIERDDSDDDSIDMSTAQKTSVSKMSPQQKRQKQDISQTPPAGDAMVSGALGEVQCCPLEVVGRASVRLTRRQQRRGHAPPVRVRWHRH